MTSYPNAEKLTHDEIWACIQRAECPDCGGSKPEGSCCKSYGFGYGKFREEEEKEKRDG